MALRHAVVVMLREKVEAARAFASAELAKAFAEGVGVGAVVVMDSNVEIRCFLLDERGSLAVSNAGLAAAKAAGWEREPEDAGLTERLP